MELALSPRGGKQAVAAPIMQIVKIKDRAQLHLLELVDKQPGQRHRVIRQRHRDGAERVLAGRLARGRHWVAASGITVVSPAASAGA